MASFNKFNAFVADIANGVHNLSSGALKILLTNTAPTSANAVLTDITDLSTGGGYTAGGTAVGTVTSSQSSGTYKLVPAADVVFTSTSSIGPFRYAVIYNSTPTNKNLIGWWDFGSAVTLTTGNTFTVDMDQTNGILQLA